MSFAGDRAHTISTSRRNYIATAWWVPASQHGGQRQRIGLGASPAIAAARVNVKEIIQGKPGNVRPSNNN